MLTDGAAREQQVASIAARLKMQDQIAAETAAKPALMLRGAGVPLGEKGHVGRSLKAPFIAPFSRARCGRLHGDVDGPFAVLEGASRSLQGSVGIVRSCDDGLPAPRPATNGTALLVS